jgi:hypothetical protein
MIEATPHHPGDDGNIIDWWEMLVGIELDGIRDYLDCNAFDEYNAETQGFEGEKDDKVYSEFGIGASTGKVNQEEISVISLVNGQ